MLERFNEEIRRSEKAKMKWDEKGGKDGKGACIAATPTAQPPKK
jgi:hypothetical protein